MAIHFADIPSNEVWKKMSSSFLQSSNKPTLTAINDAIRKCVPGYRPALVSLSDALLAWAADKLDRKVDSGRIEAMRGLEEVVQRKLREQDNISRQKYNEVVCISYQIQTGEFDKTNKVQYRGFDLAAVTGSQDVMREARLDINDRANLMKQAIRLAYNQHALPDAERDDAVFWLGDQRGTPAERDQKTLKLFVAPEFYFRGKRGAYPIECLWDVLPKIREETADRKYEHWLFVPGSCVCHTVKTDKADTKEEGIIMDNFAMVQKGGYLEADGIHDIYIEKEFVSGIDYRFINGKVALTGDKDLHVPIKPEVTPNKKGKIRERGPGGCIFEMDGVTFGLEVCLDHGSGRLVKADDKDGVQIQLIPSAGMDIITTSTVPNAIVFNVDSTHTKLAVTDGKTVPEWRSGVEAPSDPDLFPANGKIWFAKPLRIPSR